MKIVKKILTVTMVVVMIIIILEGSNQNISTSVSPTTERPVKVAVFLLDFADDYLSLVGENLKDIQKENEGKVEFTLYDGKSNQAIQNESIDNVLKEGVDLILLNIVNTEAARTVINEIKEYNVPVILFNREPVDINAIKSYNKALYIGTDAREAGIIQGEMLVNAWKANKDSIDRNKDNIMQYIMLEGERGNIEAVQRTKYSVLTIQQTGIKTEELALRFADWNTELARNFMEPLILSYGDKIEAIIANDDSMAIGAIQALQKYGYNKGEKTKTIAVVGVDALPETRDLIEKGIMLGSVVQDSIALSEALYTVGMNLVYNKNPLDGTQYKFDDTEAAIRIPHREYVSK